MLLTMTCKSLRVGCYGSQIPMKAATYSKAKETSKANPKGLRKLKLSNIRAKHVITLMDAKGYLEFYKGFNDVGNGESMMSCVLFKQDLIKLIPKELIKSYSINVKVDDMVVVRDSETKEDIYGFSGLRQYRTQKSMMASYNKCLTGHSIRFDNKLCYVLYKQVFSDGMELAGRIYSFGTFQTMDSKLRKYITVDSEVTTEVDLKANHISMLYLIQGITLRPDFDCYNVDLNPYSYIDTRAVCKMGVMCIINCKNKTGAARALKKLVDKNIKSGRDIYKVFTGEPHKFYSKVIRLLCEKHSKINFFNHDKPLWGVLQRLDSRICEYVVNHFTSNDEVVLCWHDSWVVPLSKQQELIDTIYKAWYSVFGTRDNCFIKIVF